MSELIPFDNSIARIDALVALFYEDGFQRKCDILIVAMMPALHILEHVGVPPEREDLKSWLPEQAARTLVLEAHHKAYRAYRAQIGKDYE